VPPQVQNSVNSSSLLLSSAECQADRESNEKTQTAWIEAGEVQSRLEDLKEQLWGLCPGFSNLCITIPG